jgi:Phospholipase_D-nuclease N-terminal
LDTDLARELNKKLPPPIPVSDSVAIAILAVLELLAIWCVIRIWRVRGRSLAGNLLWTAVTLVPILGLIAYAVWWDPPPPPSDPTDRRRDRRFGE